MGHLYHGYVITNNEMVHETMPDTFACWVSDQRGCRCFPFLCHLCPQLLLSASAASWLLCSFFFCGLCAVVLLLMLAFSHQCGATHPHIIIWPKVAIGHHGNVFCTSSKKNHRDVRHDSKSVSPPLEAWLDIFRFCSISDLGPLAKSTATRDACDLKGGRI